MPKDVQQREECESIPCHADERKRRGRSAKERLAKHRPTHAAVNLRGMPGEEILSVSRMKSREKIRD